MLVTSLIIAGVLFLLYKWVGESNEAVYERGRMGLSKIDGLEFFERINHSLSEEDLAIFNFMLQRPWKEPRDWFLPWIDLQQRIENGGYEGDSEKYMKGLCVSMLGDVPLGQLESLNGIPLDLSKANPLSHRAWMLNHKKLLTLNEKSRIGDFVAESSKSAALACMQTIRR